MNVRKPIIAGLIGLASFAPCKAQKAFQLVSETGITGVIKKDAVFYTGMNFCFTKKKNFTDLYAGINVPEKGRPSFVGLAINNYSWTKNISSWARGVFSTNFQGANSTLEVAPIKANTSIKKFNLSLAPAYAIYHDFREGATTQGFNPIFQTTYSANSRTKIFAELKYTTEPSKNLFHTHFGKLKDNIGFMVACMINF